MLINIKRSYPIKFSKGSSVGFTRVIIGSVILDKMTRQIHYYSRHFQIMDKQP